MDPKSLALSAPAKFIRVGACLQFGLVAIGLAPPQVGRWIMRLIYATKPVEIQDVLWYVVLFWIVGAPIVGTIAYTRLSPGEKAGTEGMFLLFWWISLVVMFAVGLSYGAAF
jgi:hypothetical protein